MRTGLIIGGLLATATLGGCVSGPQPPGTLVGVRPPPPPPPIYAPPPPPRCWWRDGPYGPERICRPRRFYY